MIRCKQCLSGNVVYLKPAYAFDGDSVYVDGRVYLCRDCNHQFYERDDYQPEDFDEE